MENQKQPSPIRVVKTGTVIEAEVWMPATKEIPTRLVYEYYTLDGKLLARQDPWNPVTKRMEDVYGNKLGSADGN